MIQLSFQMLSFTQSPKNMYKATHISSAQWHRRTYNTHTMLADTLTLPQTPFQNRAQKSTSPKEHDCHIIAKRTGGLPPQTPRAHIR